MIVILTLGAVIVITVRPLKRLKNALYLLPFLFMYVFYYPRAKAAVML